MTTGKVINKGIRVTCKWYNSHSWWFNKTDSPTDFSLSLQEQNSGLSIFFFFFMKTIYRSNFELVRQIRCAQRLIRFAHLLEHDDVRRFRIPMGTSWFFSSSIYKKSLGQLRKYFRIEIRRNITQYLIHKSVLIINSCGLIMIHILK